jgi:hypothetical protein
MKKIIYTIVTFCLFHSLVFASYNDIYITDIQYDWIRKTDIEKEAIISEVKDIIFENGTIEKLTDIKQQFKEKIKDKNHLNNYYAASAGYKDLEDNNISAFYFKNQKHIYMYALQNKKDISKIYYYSALGKMKYIDFVFGEYPDYPYYSIQYRVSGKPVSAIYFVSKDTQYLFTPDGEFTGVWYKHNLYNKNSKVILTRTSY